MPDLAQGTRHQQHATIADAFTRVAATLLPTPGPDPTAIHAYGHQRVRYFNPRLDECEYDDEDEDDPGALIPVAHESEANLVSSLCTDGQHRVVLDIDVPCHYVPSSTRGHGHLYFPGVALDWPHYLRLLEALADAGIVEQAWVDHCVERQQALLRQPGQRRQHPRPDPLAWTPQTDPVLNRLVQHDDPPVDSRYRFADAYRFANVQAF